MTAVHETRGPEVHVDLVRDVQILDLSVELPRPTKGDALLVDP